MNFKISDDMKLGFSYLSIGIELIEGHRYFKLPGYHSLLQFFYVG